MLTVKKGAKVKYVLQGHSNLNGAVVPAGTVAALASNDTTVATVPSSATFDVPSESLAVEVTVLEAGATDITHDAVTPDGTHYQGSDHLVVEEIVPGLLTITGTLVEVSDQP